MAAAVVTEGHRPKVQQAVARSHMFRRRLFEPLELVFQLLFQFLLDFFLHLGFLFLHLALEKGAGVHPVFEVGKGTGNDDRILSRRDPVIEGFFWQIGGAFARNVQQIRALDFQVIILASAVLTVSIIFFRSMPLMAPFCTANDAEPFRVCLIWCASRPWAVTLALRLAEPANLSNLRASLSAGASSIPLTDSSPASSGVLPRTSSEIRPAYLPL